MRHEIIKAALGEIGVTERPGLEVNSPRILRYFKEMGKTWVKTDETAWCSAVINFLAIITGHEYSGELDARSWLEIGIKTERPEIGDLVIFWRGKPEDGGGPDGWKGHVGLFDRAEGKQIWTIGGNQKNKFGIDPYRESKLLGFRILRPAI